LNPLERALLLEGLPANGLQEVIIALVGAFVLGLAVSITHRLSVPNRTVSPSLQASLALLPVVAAMVLIVIGDSLARAFSLVGALAIVRFRTRLRTTWDITFIFLALAAGIGCGVGKLSVAAVGVVICILAVLVLAVLPGTRPQPAPLTLRCDLAAWECKAEDLVPLLAQACDEFELASSRSLRFGETLSIVYRIRLKAGATMGVLVRDLSQIEGVERILAMTGEEEAEGAESD
jgi:uncharacterized membrane protein YhiD involved in acid resistance